MKQADILYIFKSAPHTSARLQEGLEMLMSSAAFELDIAVLFSDDALFAIKSNQQSSDKKIKLNTKTFGALADFEVSQIYAEQISMTARGLSEQDLFIEAEAIDDQQIAALIQQSKQVLVF